MRRGLGVAGSICCEQWYQQWPAMIVWWPGSADGNPLASTPQRSRSSCLVESANLLMALTRFWRLVDRSCPQQCVDQAYQLARGQDQRTLVGMLGRLDELHLIVLPVLSAVLPHTVGRLDPVVSQVGIAGFGHSGIFGLEGA